MNPEASPFTPGQPVPIEYFVGREKQIRELRSLIRAALQGRFQIGFVSGERGIGKSSLVSFVRHLAQRDTQIAGTHVFLGGIDTIEEMVKKLFDRLLKESLDRPWYEKLQDFFGRHVKSIGLFGITVELDLPHSELHGLVSGFVPTLAALTKKISDQTPGMTLILDDINGLAESPRFANWLKSTVDEIATSGGHLPVCLLIVGLNERRQKLIEHQPSLSRVFRLVNLEPWTDSETSIFFQSAFTEKNNIEVRPDALRLMVQYSGGMPVLAHEIGDAVWRIAKRPTIERQDAERGILEAAEIIGHKFLEPQVLQTIRSRRYRAILHTVTADAPILEFRRRDLMKQLSPQERKVLDNFLRRLSDLGVIRSAPEAGRGAYRFRNHLHAVYFYMLSREQKRKGNGGGYSVR